MKIYDLLKTTNKFINKLKKKKRKENIKLRHNTNKSHTVRLKTNNIR